MNTRMQAAKLWESHVRAWLESSGWKVADYGQQMLTVEARDIIARFRTRIRWTPDLLASDGKTLLVVDAKNSYATRTGRHSVEIASAAASDHYHQPEAAVWALYAFPHQIQVAGSSEPVCVVGFVVADVWKSAAFEGPVPVGGSGTPYLLAPCAGLCRATPMQAIDAAGGMRDAGAVNALCPTHSMDTRFCACARSVVPATRNGDPS